MFEVFTTLDDEDRYLEYYNTANGASIAYSIVSCFCYYGCVGIFFYLMCYYLAKGSAQQQNRPYVAPHQAQQPYVNNQAVYNSSPAHEAEDDVPVAMAVTPSMEEGTGIPLAGAEDNLVQRF